jgi:hypothetical protein
MAVENGARAKRMRSGRILGRVIADVDAVSVKDGRSGQDSERLSQGSSVSGAAIVNGDHDGERAWDDERAGSPTPT